MLPARSLKAWAMILTCIFMLGFAASSDDPVKQNSGDNPLALISSKQMDANNIRTWFRNNGSFNRNPSTGNSGFEWPKGSGKFARYASGLWIGAKVGDDTLIAIAEYDYEYLPGYIDAGGNPQGKDDSLYRIYVINKNETNTYDYIHWPYEQGAYRGSDGKPFLMGDQTMFYSYTDGYPEAHGNNAGSTAPLKAQILQTNWCYVKLQGAMRALNEIVFSEFKVINRGTLPWERSYLSIYSDDDLGDANDDRVGCDTNLNLTYIYNGDNNDPQYGDEPPAVGTLILRGPLVDSPSDTVFYYDPPGSNNKRVFPGKKMLKMSASSMQANDPIVGWPSNYRETYLILQGLRRNNTPWINPVNGQITTYSFSGDPESGTGWNETYSGGRTSQQSSGPFTLQPGDTVSFIIAQVIGRGSSNTNSVSRIKKFGNTAALYFDSNFNVDVSAPDPKVTSFATGDGVVHLKWNDTCERVTIPNKLTGGAYVFQGYNIYRIRPNNVLPSDNDTILIKTFDKADGITDIRDSIYLEEYQSITYGVVQKGSDNGIWRSIELSIDTVSGGAFINGSEYKFSVTAYYYDPSGGLFTLPKLLESNTGDNIIKVVPQKTIPEAQTSYSYGDTLKTDQGDKCFIPVIENPMALITARYTSIVGLSGGQYKWSLLKITEAGDTLYQFNSPVSFSSVPDSAKGFDGLISYQNIITDSGVVKDTQLHSAVKISFKGFEYIPSGNQWIEGPDTNAVKTAKVITNRQFQNRGIGMSFPTLNTYQGLKSMITANASVLIPTAAQNEILTGGPLRKIEIIFGESSRSYRYVPADTNLTNAVFAGYSEVPFSAYAVDELDSSGGAGRQLNTAFLDYDNDGIWNPDTSALGNYHFTYIFASTYNSSPLTAYTSRNILSPSLINGFRSMDVMYAWLPRVKKNEQGLPKAFISGDKLKIFPYRITKPEFVPGYPLRYTWEVKGISISSSNITSAEIASINVFPNPYFATSELEYDSGGEKFIYFSNLPLRSTIYIYTLDGVLVKKIIRDSSDPNSSLQRWDLKNSDGSYVASGMYIVYVDCGSAGAKTLKAAVFMSR